MQASFSICQKFMMLVCIVWLLSLVVGVHDHFSVANTASHSVSMDLAEGDDLADHELDPHIDVYSHVVKLQKSKLLDIDLALLVSVSVILSVLVAAIPAFGFSFLNLSPSRIAGWRPQLRAPPRSIA